MVCYEKNLAENLSVLKKSFKDTEEAQDINSF